jgi:hypothetical protein
MEIQMDRCPFSINKLDLENPAVLIRPEQADTRKGKNVVIGDPRPENDAGLTPSHKVVMEKLLDGEETITITIRGSTADSHGGRPKDRLHLMTMESEIQPLLTRSRRSDRHPSGQTTMVEPRR